MPDRNTCVPDVTLAADAVATATGAALLRLLMLMLMFSKAGVLLLLPVQPEAVNRITSTPECPVRTLGAVKVVARPVVGLGVKKGPET